MPRTARTLADNQIYHIINRGNRREAVFHDNYDYEKFLKLLIESKEKYAIKIYAYCLMPNHFHLVIYTKYANFLSQAMHWISSSYVRYYNKRYNLSGHLWQGRYKSFIVQKENYYLSLLRYIEANALRARLVNDAQEWLYGSLKERINHERHLLHEPLMELPIDWTLHVNMPLREGELESVRNSVNRQSPLGESIWQEKTAIEHGLSSTLNPRGRPKKEIT